MNINPFIILASQVISLYNFIIIVYCVAGWLINFNILNRDNKYVYRLMYSFGRLIEPLLSRIKKYLPDFGGLDISPIVAILGMIFIRNILFTYFYVR